MWRCLRVAVARVFALVVRCRNMMLFVYSRVGKNRDTRRGSPAGAGAGRTADHLTVLFSLKILAVRRGNDIYRPVRHSYFLIILRTISSILFMASLILLSISSLSLVLLQIMLSSDSIFSTRLSKCSWDLGAVLSFFQ